MVKLILWKKVNKFNFDYNLSLLWSNISINDEGSWWLCCCYKLKQTFTGSSPILSNFDIFYDVKDNSNLGVTYNFVGKKLNSVGVFGLGDIYQRQQHFMNIVYNYKKITSHHQLVGTIYLILNMF